MAIHWGRILWRTLLTTSTCALVFFALGGPAAHAQPERTAQTQAIPAADLLNADGTLDLSGMPEGSLDLTGWTVSIDPQRGPVFARGDKIRGDSSAGTSMNVPAVTGNWSALGFGVSFRVYDVAVSGSNVYVGGFFQQFCGNTACNSGNTTVNGIARWDGSSWSALGNGLQGEVDALAVNGSILYAGGWFTEVCGNAACDIGNTPANHIAQWNGSSWSSLGNGVNNPVKALLMSGSDLYVGGLFQQICGDAACSTGATVNNIARWNGSSWSALGNGVDAEVDALAVSGGRIYVGGWFINVCGNAACDTGNTIVHSIARWNGSSWSALGNGVNNPVEAVAIIGSSVYIGGLFQQSCGNAACNGGNTIVHGIAQWNGTSWSGVGDGVLGSVFALAANGNNLYVGGLFQQICGDAACSTGTTVNNVAEWDGSSWSALGNGVNNPVEVLEVGGSNVYVGGDFHHLCGNAACDTGNTTVNQIASFGGLNINLFLPLIKK